MEINPNVKAVTIVVKRQGRTGFLGLVTAVNEDGTWGEFTKSWTGKTIGFVRTEVYKLKMDMIRQGMKEEQIEVEYVK